MKVCGIVCEYNPFHYGHKYHIEQTRIKTECDLIIGVMSGNYVQRGEPAIVDKWLRAQTAIENGCDLIIEIPYIYCIQSANYYAKGAIDCLKLAKVNQLSFGSESNDLQSLLNLSNKEIQLNKDDGISTSKAYEDAYGLLQANDILGINYLKNIKDTDIEPYVIKRTNAYHDTSLNNEYVSASAIRKAIYEQKDISNKTPMNIENIHKMDQYYPYIKVLLLTLDTSYLKEIFLMDEGLEGLFVKNARLYDTYEEFINACTSKRYTRSSIQRTLIHLINQIKKQDVSSLLDINYIRPLAFNDKGKEYLKIIKNDVKIISRFNQLPKNIQELENKLIDTYVSTLDHKQEIKEKEFKQPIYIKKGPY